MDISGEFLRPELTFEREFGQFRNWWARDKRIVGNAFSLLVYLLSHDRNYRVTQKTAQRDLGLGRDAFLVARRKLEHAGFLTVTEHRYPAGTFSKSGRPIGGHRQVLFTLQDPPKPDEKIGKRSDRPKAENPLRPFVQPNSPVDNSHASEFRTPFLPAECPPLACAENPAQDFPPLKEDQGLEDQEPSSSLMSIPRGDPIAADKEPIDDDQLRVLYDEGTATLFRELHHRLDLRSLLSRLGSDRRLRIQALDLERAAAEVIGRSARPVGDPVAYLATAIIREPGRWARPELASGPSITKPFQQGRPPTMTECDASGHHWIGLWNEFCAACGAERDGWRDQRDSGESGDASWSEVPNE